MRRLIAAAAVVALAIAGCSSNEQKFVDAVHDSGPMDLQLASDAELIEVGEAACDLMDIYDGPEQMVLDAVISEWADDDFDWETAGRVFAIASRTLCPEHEGWMF